MHNLFLAKSRSWGKAAFLFLKIRQGKNFRIKQKIFSSLWSRSEYPGFRSWFESETYFRPDLDPSPDTKFFFPIRNNGLAVWYGSETMDLWTYRFKVPSFNVSVMRKELLISVADPGSAAFSTLGSVIGNGFFRIPDKHPGSATLLAILVFISYLLANQPVHPVL